MILSVCCNDEYYDEYPTFAKIEFTKESTERIIQLNKALIQVKALHITDWDIVEIWLITAKVPCTAVEDDEVEKTEWTGRSDCEMVVVWDNWVRWKAYIKNSSISFKTDQVTIKEIKEIHKVLSIPDKELPLLIGNLESKEAASILEKRLKNEDN
jgi:hypothetical protein